MKKVLFLIFSLFFITSSVVLADDDLWGNYGDINFYNPPKQTAVSDEQFNKTVETVKEKQNAKFFNKLFSNEPKKLKGESFQQSNETELISDIQKETPVLMIPYELKDLNGETVPVGHYQTVFEKDKNGFVTLKLYQAHYMVAQFPAEETDEDVYDDHINYVKLDDYDEKYIKIIFGSMDFNAIAFIEKKIESTP